MPSTKAELASGYVAPADRPLLYPGRRPDGSYVLARGQVWPLPGSAHTQPSGAASGIAPMDALKRFLADAGAAPVEGRCAVLAYGSNLSPGQLLWKLGMAAVVPVLEAHLPGTEIVYNLISDQGYAYAELLTQQGGSEARAGILLLEPEQLAAVRGTESNYRLARYPYPVRPSRSFLGCLASSQPLYVFAGRRRIWAPRRYGTPIAVAEIEVRGRTLPCLRQRHALDLAIREFDLTRIGIHTAEDLVQRIRHQAGLEDRPGKLKFDLQRAIARSPDSPPSLAETLVPVSEPRESGSPG